MKKAAVGFRVHSGWAAMVAVSVEKQQPLVLSRKRLQLVEIFSYTFRQPFHTAEKMPLADARCFVDEVRGVAEELAKRGIAAIQGDLEDRGYRLDRAGLLLASGRPLPEFEKILLSHALIHTADGELFRAALREGIASCGLRLTTIKDRELLADCAEEFSVKPPHLLRRVTELGRGLGAPWSQDEKYATLAAWLTLERPLEKARLRRAVEANDGPRGCAKSAGTKVLPGTIPIRYCPSISNGMTDP